MYSMWRPTTGGGCCNGCQPETTTAAPTATASATVNGQYGGWWPCLYGNEVFVIVVRA
jgi:hypothetical protein